MEKNNGGNWLSVARNPNGMTLRKQFYELLKENYSQQTDEILERIGLALITSKDMDDFRTFVTDIYRLGYVNSLKTYESQLKKMGYDVKIMETEEQKSESATKIFKESVHQCENGEQCKNDECKCSKTKESRIFK